MVSISVCMIVKNEAAVLARCLESLAPIADEIIVVDTGSGDDTRRIALRYTDKVYDFPWNNDFAAARNFAFGKATMDFIYSADADEVLDEENQRRFLELKRTLPPETDLVQMRYANQLAYNTTYNYDTEYRPKLYRRVRPFRWEGPVHEAVTLSPAVFDSDVVILHSPQGLHAPRDFAILKDAAAARGLDSRLHRMYAKELFIAGTDADFLDASAWFESTLHDEARSMDDVRASQCVVAHCARLKNEDRLFFKTALKNAVGKPCAEICCELGAYFFGVKDYEEAACWYYTAAFGAECELDIRTAGRAPMLRLAECYRLLGCRKEAEEYARKALALPEHPKE